MSDTGEAKARRLRRFEQSPRVCVYGCPGLCLVKCQRAGECVVVDRCAVCGGYPHSSPPLPPLDDVEREVVRLAVVLGTVYDLTASADDTLDLARLLVARGVRALDLARLLVARGVRALIQ